MGSASAVGGSTPLVEAKLHPPAPRPGIVRRDRLVDLLTATPAAPIVSIVAPPGYGKSVLLADWAAGEDRPVAWLGIDDNDNDAAVFVAHLAAAFDRATPLHGSVQHAMAVPSERVLATAVPRLASELHRLGEPVLLVLDDVHRLVDRTALDALTALLDYLPAGIRVALAGRREPDLPFGRFRVQPGLLEIGRTALAFTPEEAQELVLASGRRATPGEVRHLTERTEGWPAAIYLATLARDPGGRPSDLTGEITGRDLFIAEYLGAELRASLDEDDRLFLARTSILDLVEPAVAEAITGQPGPGARLRRLSRRYLLVERVTGAEESYRYHGLLRDHLQAELAALDPDGPRGLHLAAASWYAAHGRHEEAVSHALASGDTDAAARLVTAVALPTFYGGHGATLDGWLRRFDDAVLERHPPLVVIAGWIHLLNGRPSVADRMADIAERSTFSGPPPDGAASFESSRAMLRAILARHGPEDVLANAEVAAAQEPPGSPWRSNAVWLLGEGRRLLGDLDGADDAFAEAVAASGGSGGTAMVASAARAALAIARGDWTAADVFARQSLTTMVGAHFGEIVAALLPHAVAARVAGQRGDVAAAREHLVRAQLVRPLATHAAPWFAVGALLELARAYLALSDPAGARGAVRDAREILRVRPAQGTLVAAFHEIERRVDDAASALAGPSTLTNAELRLLALLPTYLSFQEIADRLFVSRNTVKTQALSIYGKLEASSRSGAVMRAVELGLLEPFPGMDVGLRPERR